MYEITSKKMKEAYATGRMTYKPSKETCAKGLAARDMAKVRAAASKTGLAHRGVPNPIGSRNEAGPLNWRSKFWVIKSPTGIILRGKNLNHIIMMSAWSFTIVVSSFVFLFVGRWIDVKFNTEPAFMLGLFVLAITLCIARMYDDFVKTRDHMRDDRHHAHAPE